MTSYYTLGLVGYPLSHSLSPRIHAAALRECGLTGEYRLYPINPSEDGREKLRGLLDEVRQGRLGGLNVTIPYKRTIFPYMDCVSATAQAVGAVNTILERDGRLVGENTDVAGFLADLAKQFPGLALGGREVVKPPLSRRLPAQTALVLGAGGSARAVVFALCQAGWSVVVAARRVEQARELVGALSGEKTIVLGYELSKLALEEVVRCENLRLIVNTTPLGMGEYQANSPWQTGLIFPEHACVYDLVYNPLETTFMQQAQRAGLEAVNGMGMLLEQAIRSFALWTGVRPSLEVLREALH